MEKINVKKINKKIEKKKTKTKFVPGFLLGMFAMLVLGVAVGVGLHFSQDSVKTDATYAVDKAESKLKSLEALINLKYLKNVDQEDLENGLYKGILEGLGDPYSVYYTKDEYTKLMESTSGEYCGIGAYVSQNTETKVITITKAFKNGPADKAGVKDGDVITKVDGKDVSSEDVDKVVSMMKGDKGTKVKLTVYRQSVKKYVDVTITRGEVKVPTVAHKMLDKKNKIGYIQISEFDTVTADQFSSALSSLKKQGMKKVIFDLRNNPGGSYEGVCKILDEILPEGTIVYTKDKYGNEEKQTSDAKCLDMLIVVLQNKNSASASEIFAGAIQDFGVGTIVGTQSFGKGIVQQIIPLTDGSAVKITIEDYYTPSGKNIHGKGITPDVKIEANGKTDVQLNKALEVLKKK